MKSTVIGALYNQVADTYLGERHLLKSSKYVTKLLKVIKRNALILDLGCGAGEPIDDMFLESAHRVIGLDISDTMIERAKKNCPGGEYFVRDISTLHEHEFAVDAIVSFYTLFHLPRTSHEQWLKTIRTFLKSGGWLLVTMGDKDFEGTTEWYGHRMWWSQWRPAKNRDLIEKAGFEIVFDHIDHSGAENHQIILAQAI